MRVFFLRPAAGASAIACLLAAACGDDEGARAAFGQNTGGAAGGFAGDSGTTFGSGGVGSPTGGTPSATGGGAGVAAAGNGGASGSGGRRADASTDAPSGSGGASDAARDAVAPTTCRASVDCPAGAPVCNVSTGACAECNSNAQCPPTSECVNGGCAPLKECTNSVGCVGNAGGRTICDQQNGVCVECNIDADCVTQGKICSNHRCLTGCTTDNQCTSAGLLCNPSSGACTECVQTADCPPEAYCDAGTCVPDTCHAGARTCSGNAVYECNTTGSAVALVENCGRRLCAAADAGAACSSVSADGGATADGGNPPADAGLPAHCSSGTRDSDEPDVDCGGADCARCIAGDTCRAGTDCATLSCGAPCILPICLLTRVCLQPTCTDAIKNGGETGPDCGGPTCGKCPGGEACKVNADCASNVCTTGTCEAPKCAVSQCPACNLQVKCCTAQDTCGCAPRGGTCS